MGVRAKPRTDAEVLAASLRTPSEFQELFVRHGPMIHRYLARRVGSARADDLLADVFTAAFGARSSFDLTHRKAGPWLIGLAADELDRHRRDQSRHWKRLALVNPAVVSGLLRLPRAEREILLLSAWERLSPAMLAVVLNLPVATVKAKLKQARHELRAQLERNAPTTLDDDATLEDLLDNGVTA